MTNFESMTQSNAYANRELWCVQNLEILFYFHSHRNKSNPYTALFFQAYVSNKLLQIINKTRNGQRNALIFFHLLTIDMIPKVQTVTMGETHKRIEN